MADLDRHSPAVRVELLREAWRATRDPKLAETYELLVREFASPPLAGDHPAERAKRWRERAERHPGEPLELAVLLAEPWTPEVDELERLGLLEPWTPDPLLASTLARRLLSPDFAPLPETRAAMIRMVELVAAQGDPRQLATLERLSILGTEVERAREHLAGIRVGVLAPHQRDHAARLARRADHRRVHEARTAELLAAVHAAPDDDAPRLVYADWLTAHGDPHGEFITLQVERSRVGGGDQSGAELQLAGVRARILGQRRSRGPELLRRDGRGRRVVDAADPRRAGL